MKLRIVLFGLLVVFAAVIDIFLSQIGVNPSTPAYTIIPLFFGVFVLCYNPKMWFKYMNTHTLLFLFLSFLLSLIFALRELPSMDAIIVEFTNSIITILFYFFVYILFSNSTTKELKLFLIVALLVTAGGLLYDTFVGLSTSEGEARKAGFGGNPNITGTAVKFLGMCLILLYRDNARMRVFALIFMVLTIFLTFSRSGILGAVMMAVFLLINDWKLHFNLNGSSVIKSGIKMVFILGMAYFALASLAGFLQSQIPELNQGDAGKRIDTLLGKSNDDGNSSGGTRDDNSQYGRKNIVVMYVDKIMKNPYGYGTAYSADKTYNLKDTHNFYLKMTVNFGFIGLLVLLFYFFMCIKRAIKYDNYYYLIFTLILMVECIASHNVFMERPTLIALAFMDNVLYSLSNNNNQYLTS